MSSSDPLGPPGGAPALRTLGLGILAFLSGCCALGYEVLLIRALTTVLGDMFYVHAALLATFLVGIGLGAKLAFRAFRYLFALEFATGLYALVLPAGLRWLAEQPFLAGLTSSPLPAVAVTASLVIAPGLFIGFSIPLFSAYVKANAGVRLAFQKIYNAYNLGALLSVLVVEFLFVRHLGVTGSMGVLGAINLLNGALLLIMRAAPPTPPVQEPRRLGASVITAVLLASAASAMFQMFFLKLLYLVFAPHRENFAIALTVTLLGLFLGAFLASRTQVSFPTLMMLLPAALAVIYSFYEPLVRLSQSTAPGPGSSDVVFLGHKLVFGSFFALLPMVLFGGTLPALMRSEREVASESGALLCASSLANAAGYLLYVLVGHPWLSAAEVLVALGVVALIAGLLVADRWQPVAATVVVSGLAIMAVFWSEGRFYLSQWLAGYHADWRVETFKSGAESATLVRGNDYSWITYNGHPSILVERAGIINLAEMMSGVIPALGAPRLDRALVLGVGTGITAGSVSRIFRATDAVEINQAFLDMLPRLAHANLGLHENPAASLHLADGRAFLVGRPSVYDAIVNSIPAPTYYSASKIYTVEFYERVRRALKPDGVFCTWLGVGDMTEQGVIVVLSALRRSFSYCDLRIMRSGYYMATCSATPIRPRPFRDLPVQDSLRRALERSAPWFDLDQLFTDHRISEEILQFAPKVTRENTDDFPTLEFQVTRAAQARLLRQNDPFLARWAEMGIDPIREWESVDTQRAVRQAGVFFVLARAYFEKFFARRLENDHARNEAFQAWIDRHHPPGLAAGSGRQSGGARQAPRAGPSRRRGRTPRDDPRPTPRRGSRLAARRCC
jgi:spermidine synthase